MEDGGENDDTRKAFEDYITSAFPEEKKRNRSAVICRNLHGTENYKTFEKE